MKSGFFIFGILLASQALIENAMVDVQYQAMEPPFEKESPFNVHLAKTLAAGHSPAMVDFLWLKFIQDDALTKVPKGLHPVSFFYLDLILELDPAFYEVGLMGSTILSVARDDGEGAKNLLERSEKFREEVLSTKQSGYEIYWPEPWKIPMTLGYVYLFDLYDFEKSAFYFKKLKHLEGTPYLFQVISRNLESRERQFTMALDILKTMIENNKREEIKAILRKKLEDLNVVYFLFKINQSFKEYLVRKSKSSQNYSREFSNFLKANQKSSELMIGETKTSLYVDAQGVIHAANFRGSSFGLSYIERSGP